MFESINEVAVLVSTILAIAVGSIWYSPLLFGKPWMRAVGITEEDVEISKYKMPKLIAISTITSLVALLVVSQFINISDESTKSIMYIAMLLITLFGAFTVSSVIWEKKPISYWLINLGYMAVVVFGGVAVIGYWPW